MTINVPTRHNPTPHHSPRSMDLSLSVTASEGLSRLFHGLTDAGARLADGGIVTNHGHALNWLLEHVAVESDPKPMPVSAK